MQDVERWGMVLGNQLRRNRVLGGDTKHGMKENGAVLIKDDSGQYHILTQYDVLEVLSK